MLLSEHRSDRVHPAAAVPISQGVRGAARTPTLRSAEVAISQFRSSRNCGMAGARTEDHDANSVQPHDGGLGLGGLVKKGYG